jgi:hypothetical protein
MPDVLGFNLAGYSRISPPVGGGGSLYKGHCPFYLSVFQSLLSGIIDSGHYRLRLT